MMFVILFLLGAQRGELYQLLNIALKVLFYKSDPGILTTDAYTNNA